VLVDRGVVVAPAFGRGAGAVRAGVVRGGAGAGRRGAGAAASYVSLANSKKLLMSFLTSSLAFLARDYRRAARRWSVRYRTNVRGGRLRKSLRKNDMELLDSAALAA